MDSAAVMRPDEAGNLSNDLTIRVDRSEVTFLANGQDVATRPTSEVDTSGIAGIRVHDHADVRIAYLLVQKGER